MPYTVTCHGGPWHHRVVAVPDGQDHFHIKGQLPPPAHITAALAEGDVIVPRTKEGTYSQVRGEPGQFEWDGWRTHDHE